MNRIYFLFFCCCLAGKSYSSDVQNSGNEPIDDESTQAQEDLKKDNFLEWAMQEKARIDKRRKNINEENKILEPTKSCPDPDITEYIQDGAKEMTLEMLSTSDLNKIIFTKSISSALESGEWRHYKHRSDSGRYGIEIRVQKGKVWVKPAGYEEIQNWDLEPGGVGMMDQWLCERPDLLRSMNQGTPKKEL